MLPLRVVRGMLSIGITNSIHRTNMKSLERLKPLSTYLVQQKCTYSSERDFYINSPHSPIVIPELTIQNYIFANVDKWPDKVALECGVTGRKYTYGQLKVLSRNVALAFVNSGMKPGQTITIVLPNIPEFLVTLLGALQAGLIVSTINPLYSIDEIRYQLENSESVCVITYQQKWNDVSEAIKGIKNIHPAIIINTPEDSLPPGTRSFRELVEKKSALDDGQLKGIQSKPDDTALLLYSSGTTGLPKGVLLTHRQVVANCLQIAHPSIKIAYDTTSNYQEVLLAILPLFHIYGLTVCCFSNLHAGCKLITLPKFEPQTFLHALKNTTVAYLVPPLIHFLATHPLVTSNSIEKLRHILNGAASISLSDAYKLLAKKHMLINSGYGMTEASPVITASRNTSVDLASVGNAVSNSQMKIINTETGQIMNPEQPGEICIKGPQVMSGYYKNPEATAATVKDGWLHTGDVGYFSNDGQLYIVDRLKELIKVKGFQVAPLELEETLRQHPAVSDVAVVGKPDARFGEIPVAFVVPSADHKPTEKELQTFVNSKVAEYKQINTIIFTSSIPKNTTGKILRKKLKESLVKS